MPADAGRPSRSLAIAFGPARLHSPISALCMKPFLRIEPVWQDSDMVEIEVAAASALFTGATKVYYTYDALKKFAGKLESFPRSHSDRQGFETGGARSTSSMTLSLFCRNSAGHVGVSVELKNQRESVHLEFTAEAAAVDRFQTALLELCKRESGTAELEGVDA